MIRPLLLALSPAIAFAASPALAQAVVQAVPGTTTADQLAGQMRLLATNANDLNALLTAGELSLKLDDLGAAASFFARAEKVDPHSGRAKAGQAAILVHAERPGEALRYFATAESYGLPPAQFASDRGLAYDLIGEQERAQRDYRLALRAGPNDETLRRYALSLGISGKRDLAEQQLKPLLAKQDRGAWRARAFVEAMTGNAGEASRIATTMMPPGTAAGMQPFLERLPTLGAVDRAFAVHFGEVRGTPQRLADARMAPAMATLGPDPYAPRGPALAAAAPPPSKGKGKGRKGRQPVEVAAATPVPSAPAPVAASPAPAPAPAPVAIARAAAPTAWPTAITPATPAPRLVPAATRSPVVLAASPMTPVSTRGAGAALLPPPPAERDVRVASVAGVGGSTKAASSPAPSLVATPAAPVAALSPATSPAPAPVERAVATTTPPVAPTAIAPAAPPSVAAAPARTPAVAMAPAAPPARRDQLAAIVGGLSIPAAELGIEGPHRPAPEVALDTPAAVPAAPAIDPAIQAAAERAAAAKALADKKAADRKAAAEKKALAEKKAAAAQKAEEAREAAEQRKLERANPERIWVQVAGGAYEGDLPKAWAAAKKKGGDTFAGHATGYTTPLRFTNRVLAGPFKTDDDARAFVNKLKAKGMSGFTFTSEAGQVVKKLGSDE